MTGKEILMKFGFHTDTEPKSIYPFSPVYKVSTLENKFIVKRTQKEPQCLMNYLNYLHKQGTPIVTPVSLDRENPQTIGGETYVVYPFIEGNTYSGRRNEIYEAGKLLGKIHALSPSENIFRLGEYDVYNFNQDEIEESVTSITEHASMVDFPLEPKRLKEKLLQVVFQQEELERSDLPHVATPYDFKANNLILRPTPFLIDPDNATWLPRIFDLALALLLFHNEMDSAPDRLFTPEEWGFFIKGYRESVELDEKEQSYWQKAVEHVFLDEVMWLMAEYEEDWLSQSQRKLFQELLHILFDCSRYNLNGGKK